MRTTLAALALAALQVAALAGTRAVGARGFSPTIALARDASRTRIVTHRAHDQPLPIPDRARVRVNAQSIDINPALRIEGRGVNARLEAVRLQYLRDKGALLAVRTHRNDRAAPILSAPPPPPTPRAIFPSPSPAPALEGPRADATSQR